MRPILSFVIRAGRNTVAQNLAFKKHWSTYGLDLSSNLSSQWIAAAEDKPIILEIGFGMGASFLKQAIASPDKYFIGIEVHRPGVGKLLNEIAAHDLKNIRIFSHNAIEVLNDCVPDHSLTAVQLFFPDPWPKKRHHKRRIVQSDFVKLIAQKLKRGGVFHMATDWAEYASHMQVVMEAQKDFKLADKEQFEAITLLRPKTKFEQRGQALGHEISDLVYILDYND